MWGGESWCKGTWRIKSSWSCLERAWLLLSSHQDSFLLPNKNLTIRPCCWKLFPSLLLLAASRTFLDTLCGTRATLIVPQNLHLLFPLLSHRHYFLPLSHGICSLSTSEITHCLSLIFISHSWIKKLLSFQCQQPARGQRLLYAARSLISAAPTSFSEDAHHTDWLLVIMDPCQAGELPRTVSVSVSLHLAHSDMHGIPPMFFLNDT